MKWDLKTSENEEFLFENGKIFNQSTNYSVEPNCPRKKSTLYGYKVKDVLVVLFL